MNHSTGTFPGTRGLPLFLQTWEPDDSPRGLLTIVHGVMEHSGRHTVIAEALCRSGLLVAAFDLRGHGQSAGHRGHVESWQDYVSDLERFCNQLKDRYPRLPAFIFAHSLGSLIALAHVMENPTSLRGLIISGTPIQPSGIARPYLVAIARLFSRFWPSFAVRIRRPGSATLSRDPTVDANFEADPLVLKALTARFGTESLAMIESIKRRPHQVTLPLLALHGGADPVARLTGAEWFFDQLASPDKQLIVYPGSYHEVYHDLDQGKVVADIKTWIAQRL